MDLYLFSVDVPFIRAAVAAGIKGVVVDWERRGKAERQAGFDTQINSHTVKDLHTVRSATSARILCRIDAFGSHTRDQVQCALDGGADEILLPMVRSPIEVEKVLAYCRGRVPVGILIETTDAVACAAELVQLPLSRVYVGLHDLAIDRGDCNPFHAISDGTVEQLRQLCPCEFGFAGLTLPGCGYPIPSLLLLAEMARLRADFTFLRRSFLRDIAGRCLKREMARLRLAIDTHFRFSSDRLQRARVALERAIAQADADGFFARRNRGVGLCVAGAYS